MLVEFGVFLSGIKAFTCGRQATGVLPGHYISRAQLLRNIGVVHDHRYVDHLGPVTWERQGVICIVLVEFLVVISPTGVLPDYGPMAHQEVAVANQALDKADQERVQRDLIEGVAGVGELIADPPRGRPVQNSPACCERAGPRSEYSCQLW